MLNELRIAAKAMSGSDDGRRPFKWWQRICLFVKGLWH